MKKISSKFFIVSLSFFIGLIFGAEIIKLGGENHLPIWRKLITKSSDISFNLLNPKQIKCPLKNVEIGYFDQSKSTNAIAKSISSEFPENLYQFHWKMGKCYRYAEPLLETFGRFSTGD